MPYSLVILVLAKNQPPTTFKGYRIPGNHSRNVTVPSLVGPGDRAPMQDLFRRSQRIVPCPDRPGPSDKAEFAYDVPEGNNPPSGCLLFVSIYCASQRIFTLNSQVSRGISGGRRVPKKRGDNINKKNPSSDCFEDLPSGRLQVHVFPVGAQQVAPERDHRLVLAGHGEDTCHHLSAHYGVHVTVDDLTFVHK